MLLFSDLSDLEGIERAQDLKYMKLLSYTLRILAAWPEKETNNVPSKYLFQKRCYVFFVEVVCFVPGIIYLKNNIGKLPFFELGHTYITVFMNIVAISRLVLIFTATYQNVAGDFVMKLHLFNHRNRSEYAMKTHILVHKMSHFFTMYLNAMMVTGILLFNATPLFNNFTSGAFSMNRPENVTFEHSVYYALPFDYTHNVNGFIAIFMFNWYISYICSSCFCTFDLFLSLMVFHLWGHLRLLVYNLENFPRPKPKIGEELLSVNNVEIEWFSDEELKDVFKELRDIVKHHQLIIDFTGRMSSTFGPILLIYYAFHQVSGCLLLLECSQMDPKALLRYGPLTIILFQQLIQISIVFELLGSLSEKLVNAVYSLPWECMDTKNRKIVFVLLRQTQLPMNLKAMDMVSVGVQTMTSILKTSFSYFVMLRTVATGPE